MATLDNAYATVAQLRLHMGDEGNVAPEEKLIEALNSASRAIEAFCGRRFWKDTTVTVRTYRPEERDIVWVDDIASTSGLIVATDPTDSGAFSETWTIGEDFELEPDNADKHGTAYAWWRIVAVGNKMFPTTGRRRGLRVTAIHGWSAIPSGVETACLLRAAAIYKRRNSPHGIEGGFEGFPVRVSRYDPDVVALLRPYMRLHMGAV